MSKHPRYVQLIKAIIMNRRIVIDIESQARRDPEGFLKEWSGQIPHMMGVMSHCTIEIQWLLGMFTTQNAEKRREIFPDELLERYFPLIPPKEGSFIGYKKAVVANGFFGYVPVIVTLEIPEDAKRSSSITRKCRCSHAKVLDIDECPGFPDKENIVAQSAYVNTNVAFGVSYKVGDTVYADEWDSDRWNECSHGIHFFMTREEAEQY